MIVLYGCYLTLTIQRVNIVFRGGGGEGCVIECSYLIYDFEVTAQHTGQWWKIPKNTLFAKVTSSALQVLKHRYKTLFWAICPTYFRDTMRNLEKKHNFESSIFPRFWGFFSSLNTDCTWLLLCVAELPE